MHFCRHPTTAPRGSVLSERNVCGMEDKEGEGWGVLVATTWKIGHTGISFFFCLERGSGSVRGAWRVVLGSWGGVGFASWSAACAAWQAVGVRGLVLDREVKPEKKNRSK